MTEKLYPQLPTAPEAVETWRHKHINRMYNEIQQLITQRQHIYKKYNKIVSVFKYLNITLTTCATIEATTAAITSATVIGLPLGMIFGIVGAGTGVVCLFTLPISKHLEKKKHKHMKKLTTLESGFTHMNKLFSKVLNDNIISDEEYQTVVEWYQQIKQMLIADNTEKISSRESFHEKVLHAVRITKFVNYNSIIKNVRVK